MVRKKKQERSPPLPPSAYTPALKASRGSSEASEVSDAEMGDSDDARDSVPTALPTEPLLTYDQVLEWWEENHVPKMLAQGWTRAQIDLGSAPRTDGKPGRLATNYPRPRRDRDGVQLKTRDAWFGLDRRPRALLVPQGP